MAKLELSEADASELLSLVGRALEAERAGASLSGFAGKMAAVLDRAAGGGFGPTPPGCLPTHCLYVSDDGYYYTEEDARAQMGGRPLPESIVEPCHPRTVYCEGVPVRDVFSSRVYHVAWWAGPMPPPGHRHYTERPHE